MQILNAQVATNQIKMISIINTLDYIYMFTRAFQAQITRGKTQLRVIECEEKHRQEKWLM